MTIGFSKIEGKILELKDCLNDEDCESEPLIEEVLKLVQDFDCIGNEDKSFIKKVLESFKSSRAGFFLGLF